MATTTPNFGWAVPTSTDLVKDGAVAIETLGDSIDASLVDLKGGTTGQVLAKASNTDMDFSWVAQDDSNAIQNAIVDAKGDLIAASANDTPARLAVGNNGETLVADSSTSTGLRYTAGNVSDNPVLNSSMQVWQRGTSFTLSTATITYTADRWAAYRNATGATVTRQTTSDTTNLPFIQYCVRVSRDSGNTSTGNISIGQSLESINSIPFAGKTVTFSFYARKGANFSGAGIDAVLYSGTGTDQNYVNGFTGAVNVGVVSTALTTTWTRYSVTGTVGTNVTQLATYFNYYGPTGTAGAADNFEITGVQLDVGSVALPYRSTTGTLQGELAACQRYYFRGTATASNLYSQFAQGQATSTNQTWMGFVLPVTMRTVPTSVDFSNLGVADGVNGYSGLSSVTLSTADSSPSFVTLATLSSTANLTQYRPYKIASNNNSAGYLGVSAEL
jgi:hypothetical protein